MLLFPSYNRFCGGLIQNTSELCEISKNTFLSEHLRAAACDISSKNVRNHERLIHEAIFQRLSEADLGLLQHLSWSTL